MIRGVTEYDKNSYDVKLGEKQNVYLTEDNLPNHMHHDGITNGGIDSAYGKEIANGNGEVLNSLKYDLFYNDGFSTGLKKDELQGVVHQFNPQPVGINETITHNNLPKYDNYYAFALRRKNS